MKQLLLFICLTAGMAAVAQNVTTSNWNFVIDNGYMYWSKTYPTSLTFKEVGANAKMSGIFDRPDVDDPLISGQLVSFAGDYKGAGYSTMSAPFFISATNITGGAAIKYMGDQCIVTVKRIVLTDIVDAGMLAQKGNKTDLKDAVLNKKGEVRNNLKAVPQIIDFTLDKFFAGMFK